MASAGKEMPASENDTTPKSPPMLRAMRREGATHTKNMLTPLQGHDKKQHGRQHGPDAVLQREVEITVKQRLAQCTHDEKKQRLWQQFAGDSQQYVVVGRS